jgi:hypothetical protein
MAAQERREVFSHAMIDCSDLTLTEYDRDGSRTYSIKEILKRWEGVPNVEIEIRQSAYLPADER